MANNLTALGIVILALVAIAAIVAVVVWAVRNNRRRRLQRRFGPEYDRAVEETGSRERAESMLERRVEEREHLDIRELEPAARDRYTREWQAVQSRFVDDPAGALREADELLTRLMRERGYPADEFEQRAAVASVDHAPAVDRYRRAHEVIDRGADTDHMREAMVGYRDLFERLLEQPVRPAAAEEVKR